MIKTDVNIKPRHAFVFCHVMSSHIPYTQKQEKQRNKKHEDWTMPNFSSIHRMTIFFDKDLLEIPAELNSLMSEWCLIIKNALIWLQFTSHNLKRYQNYGREHSMIVCYKPH